MSEFHLQTTFGSPGPARKDVENQLGAIDDPDADDLFKIALLGWGEVVVDDDNVRLRSFCVLFELVHFPFAEKSCGIS